MTNMRFLAGWVPLLCAVATLAAPNALPANPEPAHNVEPGAQPIAEPAPAATEFLYYQVELKPRDGIGAPVTVLAREPQAAAPTTTYSLSFTTGLNLTNVTDSAGMATGPAQIATGAFTALDGGVYDVISESGYFNIDGKTLYPNQGALIGNEPVTFASNGLMANGVTVQLTNVTTSSAAATQATISGSISGTILFSTYVTTSTRSESAVSTISSVISITTTAAAPAKTAAGHMVAAAGCLLGLVVL
ncbi:hypothetical protein BAUCODRAFT_322416 [Baudoinia panamericana UAMH 10762]|uniref:Uncharacterized protein n=1 Tax=Baudoinia panamericana (strain UAMH 10762) TaxID=717646 RepID=M2M421_BAUPA|nr:uncharacterized protein BAUCODRAFT_322416 [Baudoinia panamericana UAMH 10762]EMC91331.1 hypothetical protein BAUCODRAFT_322416 [Baudoinia panamericana UAMH 10762]